MQRHKLYTNIHTYTHIQPHTKIQIHITYKLIFRITETHMHTQDKRNFLTHKYPKKSTHIHTHAHTQTYIY
uniref:Uncharacterized protein n=1 Tax=Octopus bimaculoides TaxID=37653 RepID=A0A0L8FKV7_OCTBM